jgi:hypothetical protein
MYVIRFPDTLVSHACYLCPEGVSTRLQDAQRFRSPAAAYRAVGRRGLRGGRALTLTEAPALASGAPSA